MCGMFAGLLKSALYHLRYQICSCLYSWCQLVSAIFILNTKPRGIFGVFSYLFMELCSDQIGSISLH